MAGEVALVGEADLRGDVGQGEAIPVAQKSLGPLDAPGDDVLVRGRAGAVLEQPGEVVRAQAGDGGHLVQGRIRVKVFFDVLDHRPQPPRP